MKKIELVLAGTYLCQGKVYEKHHTYGVPDDVADYLLQQRNERDVPYFRLSADSPVMAPPTKPTHKGGKLEVLENDASETEPESEPTPKQRRTRKVEPPSTGEEAVTV